MKFEKRANRIEKILNTKSKSVVEKKSKVNLNGILLLFVLALISAVASIVFYICLRDKMHTENVLTAPKVVFDLLLLTTFFFMTSALLNMFLYTKNKKRKRHDETPMSVHILESNMGLLRVTLAFACLFLYLSTCSWVKFINSEVKTIPQGNDGAPMTVSTQELKKADEIIKEDKKGDKATKQQQPAAAAASPPPQEQKDDEVAKKLIYEDYIEERYDSIILAILVPCILLLLKRVFLQYINYRIHFKYYKDRIQRTNKIVGHLQKLQGVTDDLANNQSTTFEPTESYNKILFDAMKGEYLGSVSQSRIDGGEEQDSAEKRDEHSEVYDEIDTKSQRKSRASGIDKVDSRGSLKSKHSVARDLNNDTIASIHSNSLLITDSLTIRDFRRHFGNKEGTEIFTLFDIDENNEVSREEFYKRYNNLIREKELLNRALHSNTSSIRKLNMVISIFLYPMTLSLVLVSLGIYSKISGAFSFISASVLAVSFAFATPVSETLQNIVFVFFVRPYDIGDVIEIDKDTLEVAGLGLMYSSFLNDSKYEVIPNAELRKKTIRNLRKTKQVSICLEYEMNKEHVDDLKSLEDDINSFLRENIGKYSDTCKIKEYKLLKDKKVGFTVEINILSKFMEVEAVHLRKDKFVYWLMEKSKSMGIELVERGK